MSMLKALQAGQIWPCRDQDHTIEVVNPAHTTMTAGVPWFGINCIHRWMLSEYEQSSHRVEPGTIGEDREMWYFWYDKNLDMWRFANSPDVRDSSPDVRDIVRLLYEPKEAT